MRVAKILNTVSAALAGTLAAGGAFAQDALETIGKPVDKALNFQPAATELMRDVIWLDTFLLYIITAISLFVTALLIIVLIRFNKKANPVAATFTHNSLLEVAWTVVPIVVLIAIIPPSLTLLFKQQEIPAADITIKATGNQWYWTHEYVDHGFEFDSYMIGHPATLGDDDGDEAFKKSPAVMAALKEAGFNDDEFLLATDTSVVIPVNKTIVVQVTASDVIHAWTIPAFGVKQDAVPGRLAELWFNADKEGVYFGQCSELCGKDHSYMPITVKVVSEEAYDAWLKGAIDEYAGIPLPVTVASTN
ncbi:cytochrome c oxidase subunit II [Amylibacter sp. SFDW26]|uniref:cytochrome c oxidase subunit II n=1 Tax=Amylibacter sp. SFDW26 TaxID=2652722 RepID=UPI0012627082|nr:cytochrome c oxidase subunit II [Amylibacter sp. SFDW26]KAB7610379.1 cytochrome c oxidase subunit II [Amylibacter sp. SFDW26]